MTTTMQTFLNEIKTIQYLGNYKESVKEKINEIDLEKPVVHVEHGSLRSIINKYISLDDDEDMPFYLFDVAIVVQKFDQWKKNLPDVEPHYAVKCNPDPVMLETLAGLGCRFDCASKAEIEMVLKYPGINGEDIIFANPCKPRGHLIYAKENGVKQMTFDNIRELQKIRDVYPEAELYLRIAVDDSGAICQLSSKFGAPLSSATSLLKEAYAMGLNVVGISFHVGSGQQTVEAYTEAIERARSVFDIAEGLGMKLKVLDIGGGFPGDDDDEVCFAFEQVSISINEKVKELFPGVRVIAEPGRYFAASTCTLVTKVYAIRDVVEDDRINGYKYYINDGVYGSFNNIICDHASPIPFFLKDTSECELFTSTIFGPTCDSLDTIVKNYPLPKLDFEEYIYWKNMGAYTLCAAVSFNGFPLPKMHYIMRTSSEI